jgi:primosomal protein N' (replication factor Y)
MAFRYRPDAAPRYLARDRRWARPCGGRRPLGLFLPLPELGLIIVDEEHDPSFKQEDGVCYQARDMAVLRASLGADPDRAGLGDAVARNRRQRFARPLRAGAPARAACRRQPAGDSRADRYAQGAISGRGRFLSPPLVAALTETLADGEQALLFLNRRGYAPLTLCRACGHRFQCPSCTAWLVEHRFTGGCNAIIAAIRRRCRRSARNACAAGTLVPCGPGVERLTEEVTERFPDARVALMVSDTLPGPRAAADLAEAMAAQRYDVLIGTQIVAKGHHFPMLTLVGVVDADLGLGGGDLRAAERTYQLLHQVAGRAGRAERPGRVLLQTYMPEQPVMQALAANDRDRFLEAEAAQRRAAHLPPFARLAALIVSAPDAEAADFAARALARAAPHMPGVTVLGPAPAPLAVLRGRHRRRLLVQAERGVNLQAVLREWLAKVRFAGSTRLQVDIDPYSFLSADRVRRSCFCTAAAV